MADMIVSEEKLIRKKDCDKNVKIMTDKIDNIKEEINGIRLIIAKLPEALHEKFRDEFASKLTEKIVYSMAGIILTTVCLGVVYLVVRPSDEMNERLSNIEELINENFEIKK